VQFHQFAAVVFVQAAVLPFAFARPAWWLFGAAMPVVWALRNAQRRIRVRPDA
jgi:hypothetical protein